MCEVVKERKTEGVCEGEKEREARVCVYVRKREREGASKSAHLVNLSD